MRTGSLFDCFSLPPSFRPGLGSRVIIWETPFTLKLGGNHGRKFQKVFAGILSIFGWDSVWIRLGLERDALGRLELDHLANIKNISSKSKDRKKFVSGHEFRTASRLFFEAGIYNVLVRTSAAFMRDCGMPEEEIPIAIFEEYTRSVEKFGPFKSEFEGIGLIEEEMDEAWQLIKADKAMWEATTTYFKNRLIGEVKQIAAMCYKMLVFRGDV